MRNFSFLIVSLLGSALAAETIENVTFEFPPSIHEWVLLTDTRTFFDEEEADSSCYAKIYTHRAGDALEMFTTTYSPYVPEASDEDENDDEDDEDDDEFDSTLQNIGDSFQTPGLAQALINELIMPYFPNHQFHIAQTIDTSEESFFEWDIDDGFQLIAHGFTRVLKREGNEVLLSYMTTAQKRETNTSLWKEILYQANWID